ncbi:hypothetical protein DFJ74DRAFT_748180 [Hyaloraphidium curvatum]|nr:hypothetical protein DFJ74DRAFT_748180 [Hyaloraphidium curvatum]
MRQRALPGLALLCAALLLSLASPAAGLTSAYKLRKLNERVAADPRAPIRFDGRLFEQVTSKPRNYSTIVVLTALSAEHGCVLCKDFDNELKLVAASWNAAKVPSRLYVGSLDFKDGREVFQKMEVRSVPLVLHFPPTEGPHAKPSAPDRETYDMQRRGPTAEDLARYIESITQTKITIARPTDWGKIFTNVVIGLVLFVTVSFAWRHFAWVFTHRTVWTVLSVGWISVMTSGYMWNQIRHPPYTGVKDGKPEVFAPGFSSQFVLETQIVMLMYVFTSVFFALMAVKAPDIPDTRKRYLTAYVALGGFIGMFSWILRTFRFKNGGYPFKLL